MHNSYFNGIERCSHDKHGVSCWTWVETSYTFNEELEQADFFFLFSLNGRIVADHQMFIIYEWGLKQLIIKINIIVDQ